MQKPHSSSAKVSNVQEEDRARATTAYRPSPRARHRITFRIRFVFIRRSAFVDLFCCAPRPKRSGHYTTAQRQRELFIVFSKKGTTCDQRPTSPPSERGRKAETLEIDLFTATRLHTVAQGSTRVRRGTYTG